MNVMINRDLSKAARGNALFWVLMGVALLAALTYSVMSSDKQKGGIMPASIQLDDQINRLTTYTSLLTGAVQGMVLNGADPALLYGTGASTGLNTVVSGSAPPAGFADWDTAPHRYKIYHPYGGGVDYMDATSGASDAIAVNFQIRKASIVKGVGPTDAGGDIVFTARVTSLAACQRINYKVRGLAANATPPIVTDAVAFGALFTNTDGTTNAMLEDTTPTCADCVNVPQSCVQNAGGTSWGYYQVLLPG